MIRKKYAFLKLNRLILFLAITASVLTFANSFYSSYEVQKEQLILQTLDVNRAYASKLSNTTEVFLTASQQQLSYASGLLSEKMGDSDFLKEEVDRLRHQTNSFNSVVISDSTGVVKAASSEGLTLLGQRVVSVGTLESLKMKKALISEPHVSPINNLLVFISAPIFNTRNDYLGFVGGTIYLKQPSILNATLGQHYYKNGSYTYVIDKNKKVVYHPDLEKVGRFITNNDGIDEILLNEQGEIELTSNHEKMLAGYASVPSTNWIIVTQSPLDSTLIPLMGIIGKVILQTIPIALVGFICIWFFTRAISRPLQQLAEQAKSMDSPDVDNEIEKIDSWYFESSSLKKAMLSGLKLLHNQIGQLQQAAYTDPLTGANNRRAFTLKLETFVLLDQPFSVLSVDIDHFKLINDQYGHSAGDDVLKQLTQLMNRFCRNGDMVVRTGGEEFVLLLRDMVQGDAYLVAEKLRVVIAEEIFDKVGHISVSIGIATWTDSSVSINETLASVDKALYQAKNQGRNCCVMAKSR